MPWLMIFPSMLMIGLFGMFKVRTFKKEHTGFIFSSLFLVGGFASTAASLFPNLLPSTNDLNPSLDLYNMAAHEYGLNIGFNWFIVATVLVVVYFFIQYRVFKGKLDDIGYGEH
jgi:cytochrome d ubiquinol oxidase subunit II